MNHSGIGAVTAFALITVLGTAHAEERFLIAGKEYGCGSMYAIDNAMANGNSAMFEQWSEEDFESARKMAKACPLGHIQNSEIYLVNQLNEMQGYVGKLRAQREERAKVLAEREQKVAAEAAEAKSRREAAAQAAATKAALAARVAECQSGEKYLFYRAADSVEGNVELLNKYKQDLQDQKKISKISGVRDLSAERRIGEWIFSIQNSLNDDFKEYKRLGGKASTPAAVRAPSNPCEEIKE